MQGKKSINWWGKAAALPKFLPVGYMKFAGRGLKSWRRGSGALPGGAALPHVPELLSMRCHGLSSGALGGQLMGLANFRVDPSIRLGTGIAG